MKNKDIREENRLKIGEAPSRKIYKKIPEKEFHIGRVGSRKIFSDIRSQGRVLDELIRISLLKFVEIC